MSKYQHIVSAIGSIKLKLGTEVAIGLLGTASDATFKMLANELQEKLQHAEYFTCNPFIQFSNGFHQ